MEKGHVSINTENIFPIIKKWLYSEKDIFIREIVSNASDAISKHKKLVSIGDAILDSNANYKIEVTIDKANGTLSVNDNGIGMTQDEVKTYINQIAFSGAKDFLEKYGDKAEDAQIIGHFGLGFYSAFMTSTKVEIDTKSYKDDEASVKWSSEDGTEFKITNSKRSMRGTTITMYLAEDCQEFLEKGEISAVLNKYFEFLPIEIYLNDLSENKVEESSNNSTPINTVNPIWLKNPKDCTNEEYIEFYKSTFNDFNEPLFWVHLNLDFPFRLKGVLYFPKLKHEYETIEGKIKLYYNQVFVADNVKEIIPEFLLLLKGCIDCPDLPLNVSRSFLQNDGTVSKLSTHISKKVADKLKSLFKSEFENYCKYWDDINPFVKYGCLKDDKFYDNVKEAIIFKDLSDEYFTLDQYLEKHADADKTIYYVDDTSAQAQYISMFKEHSLDAIMLNSMLDNHFITMLESKNTDVKFKRIDTDISNALKQESENKFSDDQIEKITKAFEQSVKIDNLKFEVSPLKVSDVPAIIQQSEEAKRFAEMSKMYGMAFDNSMFPNDEVLIVNSESPVVSHLLELVAKNDSDENLDEKATSICNHIYDLAVLNTRQLDPERMKLFIKRNSDLLQN